MHQALRSILEPCRTKGSLVNQTILRFDFSHFAKMTETELQQVEDFVNARTRSNYHL
jgi:alanyl-tRNA synthetase